MLFRVERVCEIAMDQFYQVVDHDPVHGASRELLAGMAARQRWQNRPLGYHAQFTNPKQEKAMIQRLQGNGKTECKRFSDDASQLEIAVNRGETQCMTSCRSTKCAVTSTMTKFSMCSLLHHNHDCHVPQHSQLSSAY